LAEEHVKMMKTLPKPQAYHLL